MNASPGLRTAATVLEANDEPARITAAASELADLLSTAVPRAKKAVPRMTLGSVDEFATLTGCFIDLHRAVVDAGRAMREIRNLNVTSSFQDAQSASPSDPPPVKRAAGNMPKPDSPFAHLPQPSNFAEAE